MCPDGAREYGKAHNWDESVTDLEAVYRATQDR